jgi:hypothetical protein
VATALKAPQQSGGFRRWGRNFRVGRVGRGFESMKKLIFLKCDYGRCGRSRKSSSIIYGSYEAVTASF